MKRRIRRIRRALKRAGLYNAFHITLIAVLLISNNYGEIKIDKDITTERIDPIDAIIDAWKHAMKEEYRPDVNETVNEWLEQYEKYMKKGGEK